MKKRMVLVLLGLMCLAGCATTKKETEELNTGAIVLEDEVADSELGTSEGTTGEQTQTITDEQVATTGNINFIYNDFLADYADDLSRITFTTQDNVELIDKGDKFELKNVIVSRDYYLDKDVVENAKAGDTIEIQGIPYQIVSIEKAELYGYSVQLVSQIENDWEKGIYAYEDIYAFETANGGQNYSVIFCSDDTIKEQIYTGSVFIDKDAIINAYVGEDICDIAVKDYVEKEEYPYISAWSFTLEQDGLISFIQNQIAG